MKHLIFFMVMMMTVSSGFAVTPEENIQWMLNIYGELSPKDCHRIERIRAVFERVRAAADTRAGRVPKLLLIREADDPWIMCLEDGTIVLTQKGIEICYSSGNESEGDDRLAFILGHELAHLAKDDFWDWNAFKTLQKLDKSNEQAVRELLGVFGRKSFSDASEAGTRRKQQELEADSYGLLYASMAGYNPKSIANESGKNFLKYWADQITGKAAYSDAEHPHVEARAAFLISYMKSVSEDLDLFYLGLRLYQLGQYKTALVFLEEFQKKFPCREVSNNIGLICYQLAAEEMARYDWDRLCRDHLAAILDTETRGKVFREKGTEENFNKYIQEAIRHFDSACEKDPYYVPARVNLSSAYMLSDDYTKALDLAEEACKRQKDLHQARNNQIIALYRFQGKHGVDYAEQTVRDLKLLIQEYPKYAGAVYNLAQVLYEKKRLQEARAAWQSFLNMECKGDYAIYARKMTEDKDIASVKGSGSIPVQEPCVKPDMFYNDVKDQLKGFEIWERKVKGISYRFCFGNDLQVLLADDVVKLVEQMPGKKMGLSDFSGRQPRRILSGISGLKTFVYDTFAIDVRAETVIRMIYF